MSKELTVANQKKKCTTRPIDPAVLLKERGVVPGEEPQKPQRSRHAPHQAPAPPDVLAFSVKRFCEAHSLSLSMFYKVQALGLAPQVMKVGTRTLISAESAARWREAREAETAAAATSKTTAPAGTTAATTTSTV
jgi:hypothetical protein